MNIADLTAELSSGLPRAPEGAGWPTCQHRSPGETMNWGDFVTCDQPAEYECNPGTVPGRARYVCRLHARYQREILGPLAPVEVAAVSFDHEGGFVTASPRDVDVRVVLGRAAERDRKTVLRHISRIAEETGLRVVLVSEGG